MDRKNKQEFYNIVKRWKKRQFKDSLSDLKNLNINQIIKLIKIRPNKLADLIIKFELFKCDNCFKFFRVPNITISTDSSLCYKCRGY